jgi:hypothetical protein
LDARRAIRYLPDQMAAAHLFIPRMPMTAPAGAAPSVRALLAAPRYDQALAS